jgi:hypothetical protein
MKDVLLDPAPMLVPFVARRADWPGDCSGSDRSSDFDSGLLPAASARLQVLAVMGNPDCHAPRRASNVSGRRACASPFRFVD